MVNVWPLWVTGDHPDPGEASSGCVCGGCLRKCASVRLEKGVPEMVRGGLGEQPGTWAGPRRKEGGGTTP